MSIDEKEQYFFEEQKPESELWLKVYLTAKNLVKCLEDNTTDPLLQLLHLWNTFILLQKKSGNFIRLKAVTYCEAFVKTHWKFISSNGQEINLRSLFVELYERKIVEAKDLYKLGHLIDLYKS